MKISAACLVPQYLHIYTHTGSAISSVWRGNAEKKSKKFNELSQLNKLIPAYAHLIPNEKLGKKTSVQYKADTSYLLHCSVWADD